MKKWVDNVSEIISNFLTQGRKLKIYEESKEISDVRKDLRQIKNELRDTNYSNVTVKSKIAKIETPSQQNHGAVL